jgi:hypothetical protein
MITSGIPSARKKLERAKVHLAALHGSVKEFRKIHRMDSPWILQATSDGRRRELKRSLWAAILSVIESGLRLLAAVCVEAADVNVRTFVAGIDETPVAGAPTSSESVR